MNNTKQIRKQLKELQEKFLESKNYNINVVGQIGAMIDALDKNITSDSNTVGKIMLEDLRTIIPDPEFTNIDLSRLNCVYFTWKGHRLKFTALDNRYFVETIDGIIAVAGKVADNIEKYISLYKKLKNNALTGGI